MKLDAFITSLAIEDAGEYARVCERSGYHGLWLTETQVDPLLPLAVAATATTKLRLGTGVAIALARSPMVMAMDAWALQRASRGRLDLGLGTQVKAHVERRFSMPYSDPAKRIKEYVAALRHIWGAFQGEHRLDFKGDFYRFDLLTPFFDPGPIADPKIAVFLAAVNDGMFRAAGEVADGIEAHPFSTPSYLRDVALPAVAKGLARSGRARDARLGFGMQNGDKAIYGEAVVDMIRGVDHKLATKIAKQYAAKYGRGFKYRPKPEQYEKGHVFRARPQKLIAFDVKKFETSAARFTFTA